MNVVAIAACVVAAYTDIKWRRIPNWLTGFLVLGAAVGHVLSLGWWGLAEATTSLAATLSLLLPLYAIGALGPGDVKMMAALAAIWSWPASLGVLLNVFASGLALALTISLVRGELLDLMRRTFLVLTGILVMGHQGLLPASDSFTIPYGVAIALGGMATIMWNPMVLSW